MFSTQDRDRIRERVLQLAASDARVVAGAVVGSLAHGGGDRWSDLDLTFRKMFAIPRYGTKLTIQADLFNALNHTNFSNPATVVTNANFGQITSVGPPRNIQLGFRIDF